MGTFQFSAAEARKLAGAKAFLTMTTHAGSKVYLGVSDAAQVANAKPFGVSPFLRQEMPVGAHTIGWPCDSS